MFYKQASLFVEWLYQYDQLKFKKTILLLREGLTVEKAMIQTYDFTPMEAWQRFEKSL
jgi:hypothetical protein